MNENKMQKTLRKIENALNEVCRIAFEIEASGNLPADEFRNHQRSININSIANQAKNELALLSNLIKNDNSGAAIITTGNYAKLREALEFCVQQMSDAICDKDYGNDVVYLVGCMKTCIDFMKIALVAPARNCDVGTAEERYARFAMVCKSYQDGFVCRNECPYKGRKKGLTCCEMAWEDTPYNESEVSHGNA